MRGIPALGNTAVDMYHERITTEWETCGTDMINSIYEHTLKGSNLRKLTVDSHMLTQGYEEIMKQMTNGKKLNVDFHLETILALVERGLKSKPLGRIGWTKIDRCRWRDHSGPGGTSASSRVSLWRLDLRKSKSTVCGKSPNQLLGMGPRESLDTPMSLVKYCNNHLDTSNTQNDHPGMQMPSHQKLRVQIWNSTGWRTLLDT